jgi:hypothetical protein
MSASIAFSSEPLLGQGGPLLADSGYKKGADALPHRPRDAKEES